MEKQGVKIPLSSGGEVFVEVEKGESISGAERVSRDNAVVDRANKTFDQVVDGIRPVAALLISKLRSMEDEPESINVEFGIKLNTDINLVIAAGSAEANFKIQMTWKRKS